MTKEIAKPKYGPGTELKIYEKGYVGIRGLVIGVFFWGAFGARFVLLTDSALAAVVCTVFAFIAIPLTLRGSREAGHASIEVDTVRIEAWCNHKRMGIPFDQIKAVKFTQHSLWINVTGMESLEISLLKVRAEDIEKLKQVLAPFDWRDAFPMAGLN